MLRKFPLFLLTVVACLVLNSPTNAETLIEEVYSKALNEKRKLMVRLPTDYADSGSKRYPVLFILNEESNFEWASNIVAIQASRHGIEDMLVVGLPHTGNYSGDNYPFKKKGSLELNEQAQNHARFITEEAIRVIDQKYRTNGGRVIVGHSLSGLFVAHLFTQRTDVFSTFIALSPSLHHAPQMVDVMSEFLKKSPEINSQIYLSLGELEHQKIQEQYARMKEMFHSKAPQGLSWELNFMPHTDHMLAAYKGTYDALAWMYRHYTIQTHIVQKMTSTEIIDHYGVLSKQLNYSIKPRQRAMTGLSGFLEKRVGDTKAAHAVMAAAAHFYPNASDIRKRVDELACAVAQSSGLPPAPDC